MKEYTDLMEAMKVLLMARLAIWKENGFVATPAIRMLSHAADYVEKQANSVMRGE